MSNGIREESQESVMVISWCYGYIMMFNGIREESQECYGYIMMSNGIREESQESVMVISWCSMVLEKNHKNQLWLYHDVQWY